MSTIANTTVISNFAGIDQLEMLQRLYRRLYISVQVYEEIQAGLDEGYRFYTPLENQIFPFSQTGWIHLISMEHAEEFQQFRQFPIRLHAGEASCLAIAHYRKWLFLSDDFDARAAARRLGIRLSGSIGCLVLAVERHLCSLEEGNTWLSKMIQAGYHAPGDDLGIFLQP
jgi:predicted nucleic acid-binding protein